RRSLYHPPSEPLAVNFFPNFGPLGPVARGRVAFHRAQLPGDEGARAVARAAQPALGRHAVLVIAENILERRRRVGKTRGYLADDRRARLGRVAHALGENTNPMERRVLGRIG